MDNITSSKSIENTPAYKEYWAIVKQINDAKVFFEATVDTNVAQKFRKSALWEDACIVHYKSGDKIEVPLQYDRNYTFISSFGNGKKQSLKKQSKLAVYKDDMGNYKTEIITYLPDKLYMNKVVKKYSGFIQISNWSDEVINVYHYINGERVINSPKQSSGAQMQPFSAPPPTNDCLDYYWCDDGWQQVGDEYCTYLFTLCNMNGSGDGSGDPGDLVKDSTLATQPKNWIVYTQSSWEYNTNLAFSITSYDVLKGMRVNPNVGNSFFLSITGYSSISSTPSFVYQENLVQTGRHLNDHNSAYSFIHGNVYRCLSNGVQSLYSEVGRDRTYYAATEFPWNEQ
jgi:hypothetical protein